MSDTETQENSNQCPHNKVSVNLFLHHQATVLRSDPEDQYREVHRELVDPRDTGEGPWFWGAVCDDCDCALSDKELILANIKRTGVPEGYSPTYDFWQMIFRDMVWYTPEYLAETLPKALDQVFRSLVEAEQFEQLF